MFSSDPVREFVLHLELIAVGAVARLEAEMNAHKQIIAKQNFDIAQNERRYLLEKEIFEARMKGRTC